MLSYLALLALVPLLVTAQDTSCGPRPSGSIRPSVASGYRFQVLATGLSRPRGLHFDNDGQLLVVESQRGRISAHVLSEDGDGCVSIESSSDVTEDADVRLSQSPIPDPR